MVRPTKCSPLHHCTNSSLVTQHRLIQSFEISQPLLQRLSFLSLSLSLSFPFSIPQTKSSISYALNSSLKPIS
ncbi:hypothetical protein RIF29_13369 [Crotalaria pallida]|uniref:Uncharacterized protein n=1 Tax=Crotalaria pallida TaxID=3830 RepID=A0AAN9IP56_CROPI